MLNMNDGAQRMNMSGDRMGVYPNGPSMLSIYFEVSGAVSWVL